MKPVWIKYYGLIPMTRFGYLVALLVAGVLAFVFLLVGVVSGFLPPFDTMWSSQHHLPPSWGGAYWLYNYMWWIILACLVAQGIDTFCTLSVFAKKEAEEKARLAEEWDRLDGGRTGTPRPPETHVQEGGRRPPDPHLRSGG